MEHTLDGTPVNHKAPCTHSQLHKFTFCLVEYYELLLLETLKDKMPWSGLKPELLETPQDEMPGSGSKPGKLKSL